MKQIKGSALVWILILIIIVLLGVVTYFVFFQDNIPTPPALPDDIGMQDSGESDGSIPVPPALPD